MNRLSRYAFAAALALSMPALTLADQTHHASASSSMTEGEVKKVDKDTGKITIKHGPISNLGMPAMTMVFRAQDSAMLDQVKAGDKIRFVADKMNGAYTVTELEAAK